MKASTGGALSRRRHEPSATVLVFSLGLPDKGTTAGSLRRSGGTTGVINVGSYNVAGSTDLGRAVLAGSLRTALVGRLVALGATRLGSGVGECTTRTGGFSSILGLQSTYLFILRRYHVSMLNQTFTVHPPQC